LRFIDWSSIAPMVFTSQSRPTSVDTCRVRWPLLWATATKRRAVTGDGEPLMWTLSGSLSTTASPTSRAVDSLSVTPPGGATDSIRCAKPTCSPMVV
jgi:hypothetical protein